MPDGSTAYTKDGTDNAIGWSRYYISTTNAVIEHIKTAVFGNSTTKRAMMLEAFVENSYNFWQGVVLWDSGKYGGENVSIFTIKNNGLTFTYINSLGNVATSETCYFRGRAL